MSHSSDQDPPTQIPELSEAINVALTTKEKAPKKMSKKKAIENAWKQGIIHWKLDKTQEELYSFIKNNDNKIIVVGSSRQLGKSFLLCTIAIEECMRTPNRVVKMIAPEVKMIKRILRPLMREILADCPEELLPKERPVDHIYKFSNGSEIQIAGTDNGHAESLRGTKAHLCIIDEAGFCSDLEYIVKSVLLPTTTTTGGKIILSSTPSKSNDHDFIKFWQKAELEGAFIKKTIYDNPRLTIDQIEELANAIGGVTSVAFRREYLCELITSEEDAVVPEFNAELKQEIIKVWARPPYYDAYASMDIGFKDLTVVLFAYYDFKNGKIIIEDELVTNGSKFITDNFAKDLIAKESSLWIHPVTREIKTPYLRVSDNNNLILLNDLQVQHKLNFLPIAKDNSDAALNNMRMMLKQKKIIINPKCKTLINHLENGIWNKARSSYTRSQDSGHFDAIDSLKYLCRGMQLNKNPYPASYQFESMGDNLFFSENPSDNNKVHTAVKEMFKLGKFSKNKKY